MQDTTIRQSFVMYRSFIEILQDLEAQDAKEFLLAISEYALDGAEPHLSGILNTLWKPVKPQLEANRRRYENGKKGGAPKGSHNNPNGRRGNNPKTETVLNNSSRPLETRNSSHPTLQQVDEFISQNNINIDANDFYNYYESNGWMMGSNPIRNWQALIRTWESRKKSKENNTNDKLGIDERIDDNGNRTYGYGATIVPEYAPPRPSKGHWWNQISNSWDQTI